MISVNDNDINISDDINNLIYIVGSARGGTSILFQAISMHPEIYGLPSVSHFYSNVWRSRRCMHERLFSLVYKSLVSWFDISKATKNLNNSNKNKIKSIIAKAIKNKNFSMLYKMYPIISYLIDSNRNPAVKNTSRWMDKSNDWRGLYKINKSFPKSKFVFIVRDPRSVVLSSSTRQSKKENMINIDKRNIINQAVGWKWMTDRLLSFKINYPDKTKIIHYEDFVSNPEIILNELFLFLCDSKMDKNDIIKKVRALSGGSTNKSEIYKGISKNSVNRWERELSESHIQLIESVVGGTMTNKAVSYLYSKPRIKNPFINIFVKNNLFILYIKSTISSLLFFARR
jgi:hypothetical protein